MLKNQLILTFNLTFKSDEIEYFNIHLESLKKDYYFIDSYSKHSPLYNEKYDSYFDDNKYVSRNYFFIIDNFESKNNFLKINLETNKNIVYKSKLIRYNLTKVNFIPNLSFNENPKSNEFQRPPFLKDTTHLFQFLRIIESCLECKKEYFLDICRKLIENENNLIIQKINKKDNIEDIIKLIFNMKNFSSKEKRNDLITEIDIENYLNIPSHIPNCEIDDLVREIIYEIFNNRYDYGNKRMKKFFFVLNYILLHKKFDLLPLINFYNTDYIIEGMKNIKIFKSYYKINKKHFENIINHIDLTVENKFISLFFSSIDEDKEILNCLEDSWKKFPSKILNNLSKNTKKLLLSEILKDFKSKDIDTAKILFQFIDSKLDVSASILSEKKIKFNEEKYYDKNETIKGEYLEISFLDIFSCDLDNIIKIFIKYANDFEYIKFLYEKANNYKNMNYLDDHSIINILKNCLDDFITANLFDNKLSCSKAIENLFIFNQEFTINSLKRVLEDQRRYFNSVGKFIDKLTNFSDNSLDLHEQFKYYNLIKFEEIFKENELKILKEKEKKNINFENFYILYNKQKIKIFLENKNNDVKFLFEKIIKSEIKDLIKNKLILIEFLNNFTSFCSEEDFKFVNFEDNIKIFLEEHSKNINIQNMLLIYIGEGIIEDFDDILANIIIDFFSIKINQLDLNRFFEMFSKISSSGYNLKNNSLKLMEKIIFSSKKFLPKLKSLFNNTDQLNFKLFRIIYDYIKSENIKYSINLLKIKNKSINDKQNNIDNINDNKTNIDEGIETKELTNINSLDNEKLILLNDEKLFEDNQKNILSFNKNKNLKNPIDFVKEKKFQYPNLLEKFLNPDNETFGNFIKLLMDKNDEFFKDGLLLKNYRSLIDMKDWESEIRFNIMSIFENNINIQDYYLKLKEVNYNVSKLNEMNEFLSFYFRNLEEYDVIKNFRNFFSNLNDCSYKCLKELFQNNQELVNVYQNYSKIDNNPFKKIFEFFENVNKSNASFEQKIENLKLSEEKAGLIKICLYSDDEYFFMKEIVEIFLPLIDKKTNENLKEFIDKFGDQNHQVNELIIRTLNIYSNSYPLINNSESLINFINLYDLNKSIFIVDLEHIHKNLKSYENKIMKEYLSPLENNNLENLLKNESLSILIELLNECPDSYQFFKDKEEDDIRNLIEFVDDIGDSFIKPDTIKNCIKILDFSKLLSKNIIEKKDKEVIEFLSNITNKNNNEKKYKNIEGYLNDVAKNINGIKQLYNKIANREEYSKIKIKEIYFNSKFIIKQEKNLDNFGLLTYKCKGSYGSYNKETNFDEIKDLRDRSLLLSKKKIINNIKFTDNDKKEMLNESINLGSICIENDKKTDIFEKEENDYLEICKNFSGIVNNILYIYENVNLLYQKGYHVNFIIELEIKSGINCIIINRKKYTSDHALEYFNDIYNEIDESYSKLILNHPIMTFFHGRQIHTLYKFFQKFNQDEFIQLDEEFDNNDISDGLNLLSYLFENEIDLNIIENIWFPLMKQIDILSFDEILEYVGVIIEKIHNSIFHKNLKIRNNNLVLNQIADEENGGIFSIYLPKNDFENEIIHIHQIFCQNKLPNHKNILICNEDISILLIKSFISRAFFYKSYEPFILINSDNLDNDTQLEIHRSINDFIQYCFQTNRKIKSKFVITYNHPQLEYVVKIKKLQNIVNLKSSNPNNRNKENDLIRELFKNQSNNIVIVKSDCSGVGKSYLIKKLAREKNIDYFYFPVSGVITKLELIHRLKKMNLVKNSLLHIDLEECDNEYITRSFIFELLVIKCILHNEFVYKLSEEIQIYIEIPFGFIDYTSKYPILENFEFILITKKEKADFDIEENSENIQIVANYLINLKNNYIITKNIYINCKCEDNNHGDVCNYNDSIPIKKFEKKDILDLINEHFNLKMHSFYQIHTFINFLAFQFKLFSKNFYFGVSTLKNNEHAKGKKLLTSRKTLVESFIKITKYFTKSAYDELIKMQENTDNFMNKKREIDKDIIIKSLLNENIISYNKIDFIMIFFNNDEQRISIIVKKDNAEYHNLYNLFNACSYNHDINLVDYEKLTNEGFLEQLQLVLNKNDLILKDHTGIISLYDTKGYVFTSDNFLKMQLILLRINSDIPVIMMGETGCGKTSLIKILADLLEIKLHILNIHAGIEDNDIINFINNVIKNHQNLINLNNDETDNNNTNIINIPELEKYKIWIFLDEINTCNSLGLISEILCKRSYKGKKIPKNICFMCACNPYRLFTNLKDFGIGLNNAEKNCKENVNQLLAYKVNPLPFSLINHVFDFGSLSKKDELNYIESMIHKKFDEDKIKIYNREKIIEIIKNLIFNSQEFIRNQNSEISSVSLRDVRRFVIFFSWFKLSIKKRKEIENSYFNKFDFENDEDLILISSLLSLFLIYYLRIPDKKIKKDFINTLVVTIKTYNFRFDKEDILEKIFLEEQKDILKRVNPPKGIAWNSALLENVFASFHAIINKVPVYICGKPGCSKSLAMQLIYSSLRGENSRDLYFKTLPRLFMNCYQGSTTSRSKGIINVFNKARNLIKEKSDDSNVENKIVQEKVISLVFFDEMGLAEISKNNPLKVLHSELEPEKESDKVAFVGISNWKLDASKTNRGIFIARPDLDQEDLIETAITIAESYTNNRNDSYDNFKSRINYNLTDIQQNNLNNYKYIFEALAKAYFDYKKDLKERDGFHGTRDFYYMIKYIAKSITKDNSFISQANISAIIENSINRNFSGFKNSLELFKTNFMKYYDFAKDMEINQTKTIHSINSNLNDSDSRYLMIIGQSQVSVDLLHNIISKLNSIHLNNYTEKNFTFMFGSQFDNDIQSNEKNSYEYNEEYSYKALNKIQIFMQQGNILILSGLNSIYPSLYDLFNQNFSFVGGKKYARIALGTSNNPMAYVHNNFKCIIILNEDELENQDPPFLNRFEKSIISFDSLIKFNYYNFSKEIYEKIKNYLNYSTQIRNNNNPNPIKIDFMKNLINFNLNEIFGFIYIQTEFEKEYNIKVLEDLLLKKIIPLCSQDIISIINLNLKEMQKLKELEIINSIYKYNLCNSLEEFILKKFYDNLKKETAFLDVNFIYTYSSIFDEIILENTQLKVEINAITSYKYEGDLEKAFSNFMKKDNYAFILKFRIEDLKLLNYSKFLCEDIYKNFNNNSNKLFIFIIYTSRYLKDNDDNKVKNETFNLSNNKYGISLISLCDQIFIDNLNANPDLEINHNNYYEIEEKIDPLNFNIREKMDFLNNNHELNEKLPIENQLNDNNLFNENYITIIENSNKNRPANNYSTQKSKNINKKKYLNILHLINLSLGDIFRNEKMFDKDKIFSYSLYNSYMKIGFDSENYNENCYKNYINKIIDLLNENKKLKEKIIKKALDELPIDENWFKLIMNRNDLLSEKCDLIYLLKIYLIEQFQTVLTKIIVKIEENNLIEHLLFNSENKYFYEYFSNRTILAIENLNVKNKIVKERIGGNIIKRIFGFKLPNSKILFDMVIPKLDNFLIDINQKEEEIRILNIETEEEFETHNDELNEFKKKFVIEFIHLLRSNRNFDYLFLELEDEKLNSYNVNYFFDDFLLYYTFKNLSIEIEEDVKEEINLQKNNYEILERDRKDIIIFDEYHKIGFDDDNINKYYKYEKKNIDIFKILYLIIKLEFNKNESKNLENLSEFILYLLSNSDSIQKYIEIFFILRKYFPNYLKDYQKILNQISYPINNYETKFKYKVNNSNYRLISGFIDFILYFVSKLEHLEEEKIFNFLNELKIIKDKIFEIDYSLRLYNKSIKKIANLNEINDFLFNESKEKLCNFYKSYVELLEEESYLSREKNFQSLKKNLKKTYNLIYENLKRVVEIRSVNDKEMENKFYNLITEFIILKFQSIDEDNYRTILSNLIITDENLFYYSKSFIQIYFWNYYDDIYDLIPYLNKEEKKGEEDIFGAFSKKENNFVEEMEKIVSQKNLNKEKGYLLQTIILIFEINIEKYFKTLEKLFVGDDYNIEFLNGSAFDYFIRAFSIWENINTNDLNENINLTKFNVMNDDEEKVLYPFILKIYVITYMRIYLDKYVNINYYQSHKNDFRAINKLLEKKSSKVLVLKLFIIKILKEKYLKNWDSLNDFDYNEHQMSWKYETNELIIENKQKNIPNTIIIDIYRREEYHAIESDLKFILGQKYKNKTKEILDKITNENLSLFIDSIINNIYNNITKEKKNSNENKIFKEFSNFISQNLNNINVRNVDLIAKSFEKSLEFFPDLFDLKDNSVEEFEVYFVLFKYYLLLLNSPNNSIFNFYFDNNQNENNIFNKEFNKRFLPGNHNKEIQKIMISYKEIKRVNDAIPEISSSCIGAYLCSCETHYFVQPCGSPSESQKCYLCKLDIGAINNISHTLVPREGHCRVYKNNNHRNTIITAFGEKDKQFPFKFTEDLKNIIDSRINNSKTDFVQISKDESLLRDLSNFYLHPLCFRILNLILNMFYYLSYKFGFLDHKNYNECQIDDFDCKLNIENNLIVIKDLLEKLNIKNISLYLNFILQKIIVGKYYNTNKNITNKQKLDLEKEINEIIKNSVSSTSNEEFNFNIYKINYLNFQEKYLLEDPYSLTKILDDEKNINIMEEISEVTFPDFKYFKIKKEYDRKLLINKLELVNNYEQEYPIIHNFMIKEKSLEKLRNINKLNPFINEMINKFSYKISRKEAKLSHNKIGLHINKLYDLEKDKDDLFKKFNNFSFAWKKIHEDAVQFGCRKRMEPLPQITLDHPIANALNDDGEYKYGMYIAAGYQYLIEIQNEFLNSIEDAIQNNIRLFYLKNNFKVKKIVVQKAKPFHIITIGSDYENEKDNHFEIKSFENFGKYESFEDLLLKHCNVNKFNFGDIEFNFDALEKELSSILIQGKKKFYDEQNYIIYLYETFLKNNSAIITNLTERIPQIRIDNKEKLIINSFVNHCILDSKKGEKFLSSLTSMIFFLQNSDMGNTTQICDSIEKMKRFINIDKSSKEFFEKYPIFTINKLVDIYNYVEKLCWDQIKQNVSNDFKENLIERKKEKINSFFSEYSNKIITKFNLCTAIRRFVSRFLIKDDDFNREKELFSVLFSKEEFWTKEIFENENFDGEKYLLIKYLDNNNDNDINQELIQVNEKNLYFDDEDNEIKICEAFDLYEILGGDKEILIAEDKRHNLELDNKNKENKNLNLNWNKKNNNFSENKKKILNDLKKNNRYKN